ncbi:MAG: hypothetical protein JXK05_07895 [Campylobacterales bacterium]|nr:hypothetical protein [Campylobacterales bacterium]
MKTLQGSGIVLFGALSLLLGTAVLLWSLYHQHNLNKTIEAELRLMARDFDATISQQAKGLLITANTITLMPHMQKALAQKDRHALQDQWAAIFSTIRQEGVTHFYFYDTKRLTLLRLHQPSRYGDLIDRFSARQAEATQKAAWGLELGPMGTYTLRVVAPVWMNNILIGYVELGKEIEEVLNDLKFRYGHDLIMLINKQQLNQESWQEGLQMLGRSFDWALNDTYAVTYSTDNALLARLAPLADSGHQHVAISQKVTLNETLYALCYIPIYDATGKESAHMQVIRPIEPSLPKMSLLLLMIFGASSIITALWISLKHWSYQ